MSADWNPSNGTSLLDLVNGSVTGTSSCSTGSDDATNDFSSTLYFGNLHPFVQQRSLEDLCAYFGAVDSAKVIKDKGTGASAGYGFVKFADKKVAEAALQALNGQSYLGEQLRVNWALPNNHKEDTSYHYHIFVGDLGSDVTDAVLYNTFCTVGQCSDARVMWDHNTGRSKGYGFVSFRRKEDAEAAIEVMQSKQIGSRRIRVGWAQHKQEESSSPQDFDAVDRADPANTNIYIGNISPETNEAGLTNHFAAYGPVAEVKLHKKGGYGFVKFEHHVSAVKAIVGQHGKELDGRAPKCSWGKNIVSSSRAANASAASALSLVAVLQNTHLSASPPAASLGNTQTVMASLAAAAAANAVAAVSAASQVPGAQQVGGFGANPSMEGQQMAVGYGANQSQMAFLPGCMPQGLLGVGQGGRSMMGSMQGQAVPGNLMANSRAMMMGGGNQMSYNPGALSHQMNPTQMALAAQMMMMQGLQSPQDALGLQAFAFNPAAMASLNQAAAITSGNMCLEPQGPAQPYGASPYSASPYPNFYGLSGQRVHML